MVEKTPPKLQNKVLEIIRTVAGKPNDYVLTSKSSLADDLDLAEYQRRALATPFQTAACDYAPDAVVGKAACAKLKTCGKAVELVSKKAGFDGGWV